MSQRVISVQPNCADEYDSESLSCDEALERVLAGVSPLVGSEKLPIRSALGRVLAEPIVSAMDVPLHRNSAMDGYAVDGDDLPGEGTKSLKVIGDSFAGKPFGGAIGAGQAVRIMTGAVMPDNADTVIMQEHAAVSADEIVIDASHKRGQHTREPGEDIERGETVLPAGRAVTPADLGLIASLGIGEVTVSRRPRVAFLSTGDELRSIGEPLAVGEIYDSNRYTLHGMLQRAGIDIIDMGVVRDDPQAVRDALLEAAGASDLVITSGGVSVGEADYIKQILAEIGQVQFWKVAMKPGRPLTFGHIDRAVFFGLPGNPVSVMVTFYQFVQPALMRLMGAAQGSRILVKAATLSTLKKRPGRVEYQRGVLSLNESGELVVETIGDQGSGILSSMSAANCFIVLSMDSGRAEPGSLVDVQPFYGVV